MCKIEVIILDGRARSQVTQTLPFVPRLSMALEGVNRQFVNLSLRFPNRDYFTIEVRQRVPFLPPSLSIPPLGDTDRSLAAVKGISLESHASHLAVRFMPPTVRDARFGRWCTKPPLRIGFHSSLCIIPGIHCLSSDLSLSSLSPQFHCIAA